MLLKTEFPDTWQLRTHVDANEDKLTLFYEYFEYDLLSLVQNKRLSLKARKFILQEVGQAVECLHAKNWIHLDIKPDNVMVAARESDEGQLEIERVVLSDLDCSLQLEGDELLNARIGNVMWRSPEGQIGKGIGKPSDVFSYGLLYLYVITGMETLHPDLNELRGAGIEPELEILCRLITYFGPVPPELVGHVNDQRWGKILMELSEATADDPDMRFNRWKEEMFPNLDTETKRMISRMTKLNPAERATMSEISKDPWWSREEDFGYQ
jgi:serine/threonine protein kinase